MKIITIITIIILVAVLGSYVNADSLQEGVIHAWNFNDTNSEDRGVLQDWDLNDLAGSDTMGGKNPAGSLINYLNGAGEKFNISGIDMPETISISWWQNITTIKNSELFFRFFDTTDDTFSLYFLGGKLTVIPNDVGGNTICSDFVFTNKYIHFVFTRNATHSFLYQNGSLCGSDAFVSPTTGDGKGSLDIGTVTTNTPAWGIDEMIIWDRVLNSSEVSQLYNNSFGIFYPFEYNYKLTFRDESNNSIIVAQTTEVEFISDNYNFSYSTSNGILSIYDYIPPAQYTIRYKTNGNYGGRFRHYLINSIENVTYELDLYSISDANLNITVTAYDKITLDLLEGAIIKLQRRFSDNTYRTVGMYSSDLEGKGYFEVTQSEEYYKFLVDYPLDTLKLTTDKFYIESDTLNLYIPTTDAIADDFFNKELISASLFYVQSTNEFQATYDGTGSGATEYCLYNKKYVQYGKNIVNSSCSTNQSGILRVGGLEENITYYATFTANIDGSEQHIKTGWKDKVTDKLDAGSTGLLMTVVIIIIFAFLSAVHVYALILAIAGLLFAKLLGLVSLSIPVIAAIIIVGIIITIIVSSKK